MQDENSFYQSLLSRRRPSSRTSQAALHQARTIGRATSETRPLYLKMAADMPDARLPIIAVAMAAATVLMLLLASRERHAAGPGLSPLFSRGAHVAQSGATPAAAPMSATNSSAGPPDSGRFTPNLILDLSKALFVHTLPGISPFLLVSSDPEPPYADGDRAQLHAMRLLRLKEACSADPEAVVVDVGGFLGDFGLTAGAAGCRTYIFEVQPRQAELIRASVGANGLQDRVTVINKAAGNETGRKMHLAIQGGQTVASSAAAGGAGGPGDTGDTTVATVTLDEAFEGKRIFLLKIDVEGYEIDVLQGARQLLSQARVANLIFEYTAFWMDRADQQQLLSFVQSFRPKALYALDRLGETVYGPLTEQHLGSFWQTHNDRHLQTDVLATFNDGDRERLSAAAQPYSPAVMAR